MALSPLPLRLCTTLSLFVESDFIWVQVGGCRTVSLCLGRFIPSCLSSNLVLSRWVWSACSSRPACSTSHAIISGQRLWSRSEEHTSELQSRGHLVCRLLLE